MKLSKLILGDCAVSGVFNACQVVGFAAFLSGTACFGQEPPAAVPAPVLTNVAQVFHLPGERAALGLPTLVTGVVTYADADWGMAFLQEETGAIYVRRTSTGQVLESGQRVVIEGVSEPGDFAPMIRMDRFAVLGREAMPEPLRASSDELSTGTKDCRWVELEGIVQSARREGRHLRLELAAAQRFTAFVPRFTNAVPLEWIDARVRLRGAWATRLSLPSRAIGDRLYVPSLAEIEVVRPAPADPFERPVRPANGALRIEDAAEFGHRTKFAGLVTARASPTMFYLQDDSGAARVYATLPMEAPVGSRVEVVGFPDLRGRTLRIEGALARTTGLGAPPPPLRIADDEELTRDWDARLITVKGELAQHSTRWGYAKLLLQRPDGIFEAQLSGTNAMGELRRFAPKSILEITGICSVQSDDRGRPVSFSLLLRDGSDIRVVQRPSWWTVGRVRMVFGATTLVLLAWWVRALRKETRLKQEYLERANRELVERKRAEGELRASQERFQAAVQSLNEGLFFTDLDNRLLYANPRFETLTGCHAGAMAGQPVHRLLMTEEQWPGALERHRECQLGRGSVYETELRRQDGRTFHAEVSVGPLRDAHGAVFGTVSAISDITERKRAEAALRRSREQFERLFESSPLSATLTSLADGRFIGVNARFLELSGYSREEVLGRNAQEINLWCDPDLRLRLVTMAREQKVVRDFAARLRDKWGRESDLSIDAQVIELPEGPVLMVQAIDVTARHRAQEALRTSEAHKGAILESALDCIVTVDHKGRIVDFNAAAERTFGYARSAVAGRSLAETIIPEALRAKHQAAFDRVAAGGESTMVGQRLYLTALRADGAEFPIELSIVRLPGQPPQFTGFLRDLTELKQAEARHAQLEAMLRQSQKLEAVGTLAGGIAHDFNNILSAILGRTELAQADLPPEHPVQDSLQAILKASQRARNLVRQILGFSSRQSQDRRPVDLRPVIQESLQLLRSSLPANFEIETDFAGESLPVAADETQIHQVILNLGTNASQAMGSRGGKLTVATRLLTLVSPQGPAEAGLRPGRYMHVSVRDTGHGMDAATRERIFEPFFTTKAPGQGTGLGLAVVHGIIRNHDGEIRVESEPGQGTTFHLYFPVIEAAAAPLDLPEGDIPRGRHERILLVDDEPALIQVVERILQRLDYHVASYRSAETALAALRAEPDGFALTITDLTMPGLSGLELAREIRQIRPELPVILASGHGSEAAARHAGVAAFLAKPFDQRALAELVRRVLDAR